MRYWPLLLLFGCAKASVAPPREAVVGRTEPGAVVWVDYDGSARTAGRHAAVSVQSGRMEPAVTVVTRGSQVEFASRDGAVHGLRGEASFNQPFNLVLPAGQKTSRTFEHGERVPVRCSLHGEAGWIVVADHPFYATADAAGKFTLPGLQSGRYRIRAWHPQRGEHEWLLDVFPGREIVLEYPY